MIKWVIKDKEKFDNLVRELSAMITDIDRLVPPQGGDDPKHTILTHDLQAMNSVRELRKIMHASVTDNSDLISITKQAIDKACSKLILNRLWFHLIDDREHNIADAHSKTLEWSIQPPAPQVAWHDLSQWFRSGRDIYWIHGKPGSGKSTLMVSAIYTKVRREACTDYRVSMFRSSCIITPRLCPGCKNGQEIRNSPSRRSSCGTLEQLNRALKRDSPGDYCIMF
jgi:hypothetical protein